MANLKDILAIDVGTTAFKMGVFSPGLKQRCECTRPYSVNMYDRGKADIEPEKWWNALVSCCQELRSYIQNVGTISLSVTTPGLVPMAKDGTALGPAILFFDQRSQKQAREIRARVDESFFLAEACNLPVTGGSSLCSILWIKENQPGVWQATKKFGHTNTYMVKRLTDRWAIDPSTVSITGMYHTRKNNLSWLGKVLDAAGIPEEKLPPLYHSHEKVGPILPEVAKASGLPGDCVVLCGGNDAVLAGFSAGLESPGAIVNVAGTCEILSVCLEHPVGSPNYNIRSHVIPNRWITLFVLNTGGKALEWFHSVFCRELSASDFYQDFLPSVVEQTLDHEMILPEYVPYLQGSRYSLEPLQAAFTGITIETTREQLLLALLKGNLTYLGNHLEEIRKFTPLKTKIITTGGCARITGMNELKKKWLGDFDYQYQEQSSLMGAAMLGQMDLKGDSWIGESE